MKKIIIIPDSFKGTLSSIEACNIMKDASKEIFPNANIITIPIADGGEGSVDAIIYATGAKKIELISKNPYLEDINTYYAIYNDKAIIEMAMCAGITLVENRLNPLKTTTYGVGLQIKDAINKGVKEIIIGLGGSATNDMGAGMAYALGTKFYDKNNNEIIPSASNLNEIVKIDNSETYKLLKDIKVLAMCDVTNPLCGEKGASKIFGPQKGATKEMVEILDNNLYSLAKVIKKDLSKDVLDMPGSGAAGGMGAGVLAFLSGELKSGINILLDLVSFDKLIENSDIIFTGEGKIDSQSVDGKVISGITSRAIKQNIAVIAVCGAIGDLPDSAYKSGLSATFSINQAAIDFSISRYNTKENLYKTMLNILRLLKIKEGIK